MNLTESRQAIADALSGAGFRVSPRPVVTSKAMDGWVVIGKLEPSTFGQSLTTFTAVLLLSPDEAAAEQLVEQYAVPCINAVTSNLNAADVTAEPAALAVGQANTPMYALTITLSLEVD